MGELRIRRKAVEFILHAAKNTFPKEFVGLLRMNEGGVIDEVLIIPRSIFGDNFSSIDFLQVPYTSKHCGSVHSHPTSDNHPSSGDLLFFPMAGEVHIIVSYPFREDDMAAYDSEGKRLRIEVVD